MNQFKANFFKPTSSFFFTLTEPKECIVYSFFCTLVAIYVDLAVFDLKTFIKTPFLYTSKTIINLMLIETSE